jgi:anaerobic magnesium-protoporphyrin IX monomethyl ester cyclase
VIERPRLALVNPRITSERRARFPLSVLALARSLDASGYDSTIVDGNHERDEVEATLRELRTQPCEAVGLTVMGGPQVATAIRISRAVRAEFPCLPIIWGGYFPTLYPGAALNAPYVDYLVRGQGEATLAALMGTLRAAGSAPIGAPALEAIDGLSWRRGGELVHNRARRFAPPAAQVRLPYEKLRGDPRRYLVKTFMGQRTASYEAALGCRFRCTFCGVAAMFRGATAVPEAQRLESDLLYLRDEFGADSIQFYDHNFFDREEDMVPLLEVLARVRMPWWCYARADALINLSAESWALVRRSGLRMAYIGAETPNDKMLRAIRKGTHADQTMEVAELCSRNGVVPELSFMVAPPDDPEGETERTFAFIRRLKRANSKAEIIVYVYTPLPADSLPEGVRRYAGVLRDQAGEVVRFPSTPEEWTQRRWVDYSCHADAPWVSARLRQRIRDFVTVLNCRYPTLQDARSPPWAKTVLRSAAAWRYRFGVYDRPWELDAAKRLVQLMDPRVTSI